MKMLTTISSNFAKLVNSVNVMQDLRGLKILKKINRQIFIKINNRNSKIMNRQIALVKVPGEDIDMISMISCLI